MTSEQRIKLARQSLKGLSIGDAFGESFFGEMDEILSCIRHRNIHAILGGMTMMSTEEKYIPQQWLASVEDFETSSFLKK